MMKEYESYQSTILGVQTVEQSQVNKYGIVDGMQIADRVYTINNMVEKPRVEEALSNVAVLGRYIITPGIFKYLEKQEIGAGGEIKLTDAFYKLAQEEKMYAYDFVGSKMGFLEATVEFALNREDLGSDFKAYLKEIVKAL